MKLGYTGLESAGKSQLLAVKAVQVLDRNRKWAQKREKIGLKRYPRVMAFDTPMSDVFISAVEKEGFIYLHFTDLYTVLGYVEIDIFIHEIIKWFPQRGSEPLNPAQIEFLSQGAKEGINIYFACQDFGQAHKQFRNLVNELYLVKKIIGSDRPCRSAPPIKYIWGIVLYWELDPRTFKGDNYSADILNVWPQFYWINREDTELYNTSYRVRSIKAPPVKFIEQENWYLDEKGEVSEIKKKWIKQ